MFCGYKHSSNKYRNQIKCAKYAEAHTLADCDSIIERCSVCIEANKRYNTNRNVNHKVTDLKQCQSYLLLLKNVIRDADYPLNPLNDEYLDLIKNAVSSSSTRKKEVKGT